MRQILRIFKKDVRRHWPEILISLAFLGLYLCVTLRNPGRSAFLASGSSLLLAWFSADSIPALMVVFWVFLSVRLVQGESLVGDRQWWVTKPYEWWNILVAKLSFFAVFISLPLFFAQLYLLHHAGFAVLPNLRGVLSMQLALTGGLFIACTALGCLTKNLWQAALACVFVLIATVGLAYLLQKVPNSSLSSAAGHWWGDSVISFLSRTIVVGAVLWQYARRKTWHARGLVIAGAALSFLPSVLTPYTKLLEQKYPLVDSSSAPLQFALTPIQPVEIPERFRYGIPPSEEVNVGIPLSASGIAPGRIVEVDGVKTYIQSSAGPKLDLGWESRGGVWWPNQQSGLMFKIERKEFEKLKADPVSLQFELALTEFDETEARELTLLPGRFRDETLGYCHLNELDLSELNCTQPFASPRYTATFDPPAGQCEIPKDAMNLFENRTSHAEHLWSASSQLLNPVEDYRLYFGTGGWVWHAYTTPGIPKRIYLCPGAKIRLATPQVRRHVRIRIQFDNIRLKDYAD